MDIVIRSPNWIGDCIMCLPALRFIKKNLPSANIHIAAQQYLCPLYKHIEEITGIIPLPGKKDNGSLFRTARFLKQYRFHRGLLFTNSFHSALLFRLAGIADLTGYVKDCRGWLLRRKLPFPDNRKHHIYFYLDLAAHFLEKSGCPVPAPTPEEAPTGLRQGLVVSPVEKEEVSANLACLGVDLSRPLLGMSPSSAYGSAKEWPPDRFRELIRHIRREKTLADAEILLFGSAGEAEKIAGIVDPISDKGIHNLAGRLSLRLSLAAISLCSLFISNDSGLMHVASGFNLPLVALFGPTLPHKTGPLNANAAVHYHPPGCAPCLHRVCPLKKDNHICMRSISVDEVMASVVSLWPGSTGEIDTAGVASVAGTVSAATAPAASKNNNNE